MPLALIAAIAGGKNVIGVDGDLPWHFKSDLKFFKEKTLGHSVLMGRITYQSILKRLGKPLPGRTNIIVTRDKTFKDDRVKVIYDLKVIPSLLSPDSWLFVIGGAAIYQSTLEMADVLFLTRIEKEFEGDAFFPAWDEKKWALTEEKVIEENGIRLRLCTYLKKPSA